MSKSINLNLSYSITCSRMDAAYFTSNHAKNEFFADFYLKNKMSILVAAHASRKTEIVFEKILESIPLNFQEIIKSAFLVKLLTAFKISSISLAK